MAQTESSRTSITRSLSRSIVAIVTVGICATPASLAAQYVAHAINNHNYGTEQQTLTIGGVREPVKSVSVTQAAAPGGTTAAVSLTSYTPGRGLTSLIRGMLHTQRFATLSAGERPASGGTFEIDSYDSNNQPVSALTVLQPSIQQVELPVMDAGSKTAFTIGVSFFPAASRSSPLPKAAGEKLVAPDPHLVLSDFALTIDGIDCSRVVRVQLPTATASRPGALPTFTPLVLEVSTNYAAPFQQWLTANGPKNGVLTVLAPDLRTPVYVVKLNGLRIQTIGTTSTPAGMNAVQRSVVTMSVAGMDVGVP